MPLLSEDLRSYAQATRSTGKDPLVQIWVDGQAKQQRVIDILNALAGAEIQTVTFSDLADE